MEWGRDPRLDQLEFMGKDALTEAKIFEAIVTLRYPDMAWRRPVELTIEGRGNGFACRLCIAQHGFKTDTGEMFASVHEFADHLREKHWTG